MSAFLARSYTCRQLCICFDNTTFVQQSAFHSLQYLRTLGKHGAKHLERDDIWSCFSKDLIILMTSNLDILVLDLLSTLELTPDAELPQLHGKALYAPIVTSSTLLWSIWTGHDPSDENRDGKVWQQMLHRKNFPVIYTIFVVGTHKSEVWDDLTSCQTRLEEQYGVSVSHPRKSTGYTHRNEHRDTFLPKSWSSQSA